MCLKQFIGIGHFKVTVAGRLGDLWKQERLTLDQRSVKLVDLTKLLIQISRKYRTVLLQGTLPKRIKVPQSQ